MKIGVDFDDVIFDGNTTLAEFHNRRYGTNYTRDEQYTWNLHELWGCTVDESITRVGEWYLSPEHAAGLPMPGVIEVITQLARDHELHIITSRPAHVEALTRQWLEANFPSDPFTDLHFTSHFWSKAKTKAEVCRDLGIDVLIEDAPVHAENVASSGTPVFLLDAPWNEDMGSLPHVTRVYSWADILKRIKEFVPSTPAA